MVRTFRLIDAAALSAAGLWVAACAESSAPIAPKDQFRTELITCQASVTAGTFICASPHPTPPPGMGLGVTLGGQGIYVLLASSGTGYNSGTQVFSTNVTVQNLIVQPMNSADGTTADTGGVKVFFNSGPTATLGSGTITVNNADGTGTFTGSTQPFFRYNSGTLLASGATSAPKTWQFGVPNTVTTFEFTVFVTTRLPADSSVLRWITVPSGTTRKLSSVSACGGSAYAVGDSGTILSYDGTSWGPVSTGLSLSKINLYGVVFSCAGRVYAVGDSGKIVRFTGSTWSVQSTSVLDTLFNVDETGDRTAARAAVGAHGVILYTADGTSWTQQASPTTADLYVTGPVAGNDRYAAGAGGALLHYDGTSWSLRSSNTANDLHGVAGAANSSGVLTDIWWAGSGGTIEHSSDGTIYSPQTSGTAQGLFGGIGLSTTDVYLVGSAGTIIHWNGTSWSGMASGSAADLKAISRDPEEPGNSDLWVVGTGGKILHGVR